MYHEHCFFGHYRRVDGASAPDRPVARPARAHGQFGQSGGALPQAPIHLRRLDGHPQDLRRERALGQARARASAHYPVSVRKRIGTGHGGALRQYVRQYPRHGQRRHARGHDRHPPHGRRKARGKLCHDHARRPQCDQPAGHPHLDHLPAAVLRERESLGHHPALPHRQHGRHRSRRRARHAHVPREQEPRGKEGAPRFPSSEDAEKAPAAADGDAAQRTAGAAK